MRSRSNSLPAERNTTLTMNTSKCGLIIGIAAGFVVGFVVAAVIVNAQAEDRQPKPESTIRALYLDSLYTVTQGVVSAWIYNGSCHRPAQRPIASCC